MLLERVHVMAVDGQLLALRVSGADDGISDASIVRRVIAWHESAAVLTGTLILIARDGRCILWCIRLHPVLYDGFTQETDNLFVPEGEESPSLGISRRNLLLFHIK